MTPADAGDDADETVAGGQRLDKWLWFARVAKSRTLSATLVSEGKVRINGVKVIKPAQTVKVGDTVTIVMRQRMRVLKVAGFALRRGNAEIASKLFEDRSPAPLPKTDAGVTGEAGAAAGHRAPGSGRPTKRQRREMERFKFGSSE